MKDDTGWLSDIVEAIDAIMSRHPTLEDLKSVPNLEVWVLHHLQIIGEAMTRLSESLRKAHPEVPWQQVIGMRNVIVHGYDRVDLTIVQGVIDRDLAPLRAQIVALLESLT